MAQDPKSQPRMIWRGFCYGPLSASVLNPLLSVADMLGAFAEKSSEVRLSALGLMVMGLACSGIAVALYPAMRQRHPAMALGSVLFRSLEGVLHLLVAVAFAFSVFRQRPKLPVFMALALVVVSFLGGAILPAAVQSLIVEPREFAFEKKYLEHNIKYTRLAYGLDRISPTEYLVGGMLNWSDLEDRPGTINNVQL